MHSYPFLFSSPCQYFNFYSYPRFISLNPYFYPYSPSYPVSLEMRRDYNNDLSGIYNLTSNPELTIYSEPLEWKEKSFNYPINPQYSQTSRFPHTSSLSGPLIPSHPTIPPHFNPPAEQAKKTIENKWNWLNGAPGKPISGLEKLGVSGGVAGSLLGYADGYRIRYQDGAIYTKNPAGPAYWVHGFIGQKYDALGDFRSWLGFPTSDEVRLEDGGVISHFEKGEIYWWNDIGAIEMNEVVMTYSGIHCFGTTDGPGKDDIYAIFTVIAPGSQPATGMTRLYKGVDDKQSVPDNIELYRGKPMGLTLNFVLFERDQGDPNVYMGTVKKAVDQASLGIAGGLSVIATPAVGAAVGVALKALEPLISKEINNLLGTADDFLGEFTVTLSVRDMIQLALRPEELVHNLIRKKLETHLLNGDGGSYKGYFNLNRTQTLPRF